MPTCEYDLCGSVRNIRNLFFRIDNRAESFLSYRFTFKTSRLYLANTPAKTRMWKIHLLIAAECSQKTDWNFSVLISMQFCISRNAIVSNYLLIYWDTQKIRIKAHRAIRISCVKCSSKCKSNSIGSLCNFVVFDRSTFSSTTFEDVFREKFSTP